MRCIDERRQQRDPRVLANEALAFVIERGVITMPIAELAAAWGWPHCAQVYRALDRWARDGLIERRGRVIRAPAADRAGRHCGE